MYGIEIYTAAAGAPVAAAELRAWLRTNDATEDALLDQLLAAAVDLFESETGRPVLATVYRQHLSRWPYGPATPGDPSLPLGGWAAGGPAIAGRFAPWSPGQVVLGRGGVTAVAGVYRRLADGTAEALTGWVADLFTPPARVSLAGVPDPVLTSSGVPVSPVGYVQYTAGWANAAAVPGAVATAVKLLAAHWYRNPEAFTEKKLDELPAGWCRVVNRYRTGLTGDWGQ